MKIRLSLAFCVAVAVSGARARADSTQNLFVIERNKNANYVQYDVQTADDGSLVAREPVIGYWIMRAEDGRREAFKWEEKRAYGFSVKRGGGEGSGYEMTLHAFEERKIRIYRQRGKWRAVVTIANRTAFLDKLYIAATEGRLLPTVEYVDLFGTDVATGQTIHERMTPP